MADLTSLLNTLLEKTAQNKLQWQATADPNVLRAALPDGASFELTSDPSIVGIATKSAAGEPLPSLSIASVGTFMPHQVVLAELAVLAAQSAAGPGDPRAAAIVEAAGRL